MTQTIHCQRDLQFEGDAAISPNVKGDMLPERMTSIDWMDGTTLDATNAYTVTVGGTNDAISLVAGGASGVNFRTGDTDNEICFMANGLCFDIDQNPAIETKMEITDVTATTAFFGFVDATSDTTPEAFMDADSGTITEGSGISDVCGFIIDADLDTSTIYCASVNTSGTPQEVDTGVLWTDGDSYYLRVSLDSDGTARFYMGATVDTIKQVGTILLAVADVPLCAGIDAGNRTTGTTAVIVRYLAKFQDVA